MIPILWFLFSLFLFVSTVHADMHDGAIYQFGSDTISIGTSYSCGFLFRQATPFCGFKVSKNGGPESYLFDASGSLWQQRGAIVGWNGMANGCFRPRMVKNSIGYVLWVNCPTAQDPYLVLFSTQPGGPFYEIGTGGTAECVVDLDLFVDSAGNGWVVCAARPDSHISIQQLSPDFTHAVGAATAVTGPGYEAPTIWQHGGNYLVAYTPQCAFCVGTSILFKVASSMDGSWTNGGGVLASSCGQLTSVNTINGQDILQSDLWLGPTVSQSQAGQFTTVLTYQNGIPQPFQCSGGNQPPPPLSGNFAGTDGDHVGTWDITPDGLADYRINLSGLRPAVITRYTITDSTNGTWRTAGAPYWNIWDVRSNSDATLWFGVYGHGPWNVRIDYLDGQSDNVTIQ